MLDIGCGDRCNYVATSFVYEKEIVYAKYGYSNGYLSWNLCYFMSIPLMGCSHIYANYDVKSTSFVCNFSGVCLQYQHIPIRNIHSIS